jgi:transposase-like protein
LQSLEEIVAKLRAGNKELIEVVAKAIFEAEAEDNGGYGEYTKMDDWDKNAAGEDKDHYRILAKAAIVAMNLYVANREKDNKNE